MNNFRKEIQSASEILDLINHIEIELKPQNWKVKGIDIWPILRISLYYELSMKLLSNRKVNKNKFQIFIRVLRSIIFSFKNYKTKTSVLFVSDGISYINFYNKLYERFCDPLIEFLVENKTTWGKWDIAGDLVGNKYFTSSNINASLDFLVIKSKIKFFNSQFVQDTFVIELCEFINSKTQSVSWNSISIQKKIDSICRMVDWYKKQLNPDKTKMALLVSFYSDRGMALIKACKDLGIKTADIQHGIQGELHAAYGNWINVPSNGYNTMPDTFLVWSEVEAKANQASTIIGNVFESKWYSNDEIVTSFDQEILSISKKLSADKNILFTVQYGIKYIPDLFELIKNTQCEFNWLIRFHPLTSIEEKNDFIKMLKSYDVVNYEFELSTSLPLYSLLRNVSLHITHSSSTVLEALNFNVPSLLIDKFGREYYSEYLGSQVKYESLIEKQVSSIKELSLLTYKEMGNVRESNFKENFVNFINLNV
jgi:hypothetical protein